MSDKTTSSVKILLLAVFSLLVFFAAMPEDVSATAGWWNSSWQCRKNITIDYTKVNGTQSNFPVLINLTDAQLVTKAQNNGYDIAFVNSTGDGKLDHEIEHFNETTGWLVAWVRIPTLSNTTNTTIGMYYNNSGASSQQNVTGVWDDNYAGVWHMTEVNATDSTQYGNNGTESGGVTYNAPGHIDGSLDFDGSDDYIQIGQDLFETQNTGTIAVWVSIDDNVGSKPIFSSSDAASGTDFMQAHISDDKLKFSHRVTNNNVTGDTQLQIGQCYHVAVTSDGSTWVLYVNSIIQTLTVDGSNTGDWFNDLIGTNDIRIGRRERSSDDFFFNGTIDEVRISNTTRSSGWIKTSYNNQYTPSTFYTLAGEETYTEDSTPYLEVNLITPFDNTIVSQNKTFVVNATIYCRAADCGTVNGTVRYNKTTSTPDEPVSNITGDTPFYVISGINTINCTTNPLSEGEYCNLSWTLNATGGLSERYEIDVLLESNITSSNNTRDSSLKIDLALIIGLEFTEINFGILDPGSVNQPADNNTYGYNVSVDINSDDVENLWIRGTNLTNDNSDNLDCTTHEQYSPYEGNTTNYPCMIGVENVMWSLESSPAPAEKYNLTGNYERVNKDYHTISAGDAETTYYWINVPYGVYAGPYTGTITFMANATW